MATTSLLSPPAPPTGSLLAAPPPPPPPPPPSGGGAAEMRAFGDTALTRRYIYEDALQAAQDAAAVSNDNHTLRLRNLRYADPEEYSRRQQKDAVLTGQTLARRLKGTWELVDNATGKVIDHRDQVVARVPFLTHRGTFIHRGTEYTINHQQRLRPATFVRQKENGELEAHANITPGKGPSHRYFLDPVKGVF